MKFNFPKILKAFPLSEYAPELTQTVMVWANPTGKILADLPRTFQTYIQSEGADGLDDFLAVMSELLSQGEPDTRWSVEDLHELIDGTQDTDPVFWMWFNNRVLQEIRVHRAGVKKN